MSGDRERALARIEALAREYAISVEEIARRLGDSVEADQRSAQLIPTILTYLGALFVFAGLVAAANLLWPSLGSASRVLVSLGSGLIALIVSIACHEDPRFHRASLPLFVMAAVLQPAGLFIFLSEYARGGDDALGAAAVFGTMTIQMLLVMARYEWTRSVFFAVAYGFCALAALMTWLAFDDTLIAFLIGLSGLLVTIGVDRTRHRAITPVAYPVFAGFLAISVHDAVEGSFPLDAVLIGVAAGMIVTAVFVRSRSLLTAGVIVTLGYLAYYTDEYFANALGWPISLIGIGAVMIGLSSWAYRVGTRIGD
jgi:hypothetical protein